MKRALLIGINTYPSAPLRGCLNDISNMAQYLTSRLGWKPEDIRMIADNRADTAAIMERLNWFVADVKPEDFLFFHFSGHGVQIATRDRSQEIDGLLEAFCPYDFDWSPQRMITDKQLFSIFQKIPVGTVFNWVNDSCHSGDLTRAISQNVMVPRTIPPPVDIAWRNLGAKSKKSKIHGVSKSITNGTLDVGFVSGCRSDQTSADSVFNGQPQGALTHYLIEALRGYSEDTQLDTVVDATGKALRQNGYPQIPQVEGTRKARPFLKP
jgi:uncharacterized caspase-like protein